MRMTLRAQYIREQLRFDDQERGGGSERLARDDNSELDLSLYLSWNGGEMGKCKKVDKPNTD